MQATARGYFLFHESDQKIKFENKILFSSYYKNDNTSSKTMLASLKSCFIFLISLMLFQNATAGSSHVKPGNDYSLDGLPIIEVPANGKINNTLVILVSGDGGWTTIDRKLSDYLSRDGFSVIGINSLRYFWKVKSPEEASHDLGRIIAFYKSSWKKSKVVLIGYSFGGDVLPFMIDRLPDKIHEQINYVVLLGSSCCAEFEVKAVDLINDIVSEFKSSFDFFKGKYNVKNSFPPSIENDLFVPPVIERSFGIKFMCLYGENEIAPLCPLLDATKVKTIRLKGGHHFNRDYRRVAVIISDAIKSPDKHRP